MTPNSPKARARLIATLVLLPFACLHGIAHAQSEPPIQGPNDGPPDEPDGGDHIAIGVGGAYMPAYIGSDEYRFQPLPAIDIKQGRFFVNFQDGIGANLIDTETITIGAGVVMADSYRAKDVPAGIGKLNFGAGARGFVKLRQAGFEAEIGGTQIFAGSTKGFVADASLSYPIFVNQRLIVAPSIGTTWGNRKHNNRYWGISEQQSLDSGLPQFSVGSGFIDAKAEINAMYRVTDRVSLGVSGGLTTLVGDMKDSPIIKSKTRPFGILFASYEF